jgi:hypothetical protein
LDYYKPYTNQTSQSIRDKTKSATFSTGVYYRTKFFTKNDFLLGINYRHISYEVNDQLNYIYYHPTLNGQPDYTTIEKYVYQDPLDLCSYSNSFGLNVGTNSVIYKSGKQKGELGLNIEVYFIEYFKTIYKSNDPTIFGEETIKRFTNNFNYKKNFFLSNSNVSLFYKHIFLQTKRINIGGKLSVGTNIYSSWKQFQKYAWLGLGLEVGWINKKI